MRNIYYEIMMDAIQASINNPKNKESDKFWKFQISLGSSVSNFFILLAISFIFDVIYKIDIFNSLRFIDMKTEELEGLINDGIIFIIPLNIINYFLFFHKNRYKRLSNKYPKNPKKGIWFLVYFLFSIISPLFTILITKYFVN